jgi:hypothetical protein
MQTAPRIPPRTRAGASAHRCPRCQDRASRALRPCRLSVRDGLQKLLLDALSPGTALFRAGNLPHQRTTPRGTGRIREFWPPRSRLSHSPAARGPAAEDTRTPHPSPPGTGPPDSSPRGPPQQSPAQQTGKNQKMQCDPHHIYRTAATCRKLHRNLHLTRRLRRPRPPHSDGPAASAGG